FAEAINYLPNSGQDLRTCTGIRHRGGTDGVIGAAAWIDDDRRIETPGRATLDSLVRAANDHQRTRIGLRRDLEGQVEALALQIEHFVPRRRRRHASALEPDRIVIVSGGRSVPAKQAASGCQWLRVDGQPIICRVRGGSLLHEGVRREEAEVIYLGVGSIDGRYARVIELVAGIRGEEFDEVDRQS